MSQSTNCMTVRYGFFRGDELLYRGTLLIVPDETFVVNGEAKIIEVDGVEVGLFEGLTFRSKFEEPACSIFLEYYIVGTENFISPQMLRLHAAIRMGVETSEEPEAINLPDHTLVFSRSVHRTLLGGAR